MLTKRVTVAAFLIALGICGMVGTIRPVLAIQIACASPIKLTDHQAFKNEVSKIEQKLRLLNLSDQAMKVFRDSWLLPPNPGCARLEVTGRIEAGDAARLESALQQNPLSSKITLISPGGAIDEAIQMAAVVRRYLISVEVPALASCTWEFFPFEQGQLLASGRFADCSSQRIKQRSQLWGEACLKNNYGLDDCVCLSACVLVLAAAPARQIWDERWEVQEKPHGPSLVRFSNIGIHRPTADWLGTVSGGNALGAMRAVRRAISESLADSEVPVELVDLMFQTPSGKMRYLTSEEVARFLPFWSPAWEEKVAKTCGLPGTFSDLLQRQREMDAAGKLTTSDRLKIEAQIACAAGLQRAESLATRR